MSSLAPARRTQTLCVYVLGVLGVLGGAPRSASADVSQYIGKPIVSVRLMTEGRETVDPALLHVVETTVGQPLSMAQVRESIAHLFSLGEFEDVRADASIVDGGVALRYDLVPIHRVTDVRIQGRTNEPGIDTRELQRAVRDRYGISPQAGRANELAQAVADVLAQRGYRHARVTPSVQIEHERERAIVTLTIDPGVRTTVGRVEIVGAPSIGRDEFLRRLGLTAGAPFEREALDDRIDRYVEERRRSGYYEAKVTPAITFSDDDRVAQIVLTVSPGPHVRVVFTGDPLPADVRADLVPVQREGSVDEDLLEDSTARIEDYLRNLGYRDAKAPHTREPVGGELVITFTIRRGPLYRVASLQIEGNTVVRLTDLEPSLRLREGQPFSDGRLDADASLIEDVYRRRGYAAAKVQPSAVPHPTANPAAPVPVDVRLVVFEGAQTFVDAVSFAGARGIPESALGAKLVLRSGAPYVPGQLAVDRDAIAAMYADRGYENATVTPLLEFSADNAHVRIIYSVREGPQVFVDHILITGNVRTATSAIEQQLELKAGDPLSLSKINDSQRRLLGLGLFRRARIDELRHGDESRRDLLITVEESPPSTIGYGLGGEGRLLQVAQDSSGAAVQRLQIAPSAFTQYSRRNLFGKAQSINLFASVSVPLNQTTASGGLPEYQFLGTYREPRLLDTPTDGLLNFTVEQQIRSSFTFRRDIASAQVSRRLTRGLFVTGAYQIERTELLVVNVSDQDIHLINQLFSKAPLRLSGFTASVIRDTRNDQANPSAGQYFSVNGQVDGVALGSEVGFAKSFFRAETFHALPHTNGVVFAGNASLGLAEEFNRAAPIPEPERFFAGGDTTNRGFALDTLGVRHDPPQPGVDTIDSNGFPIGGNATVILNGELRVPVHGGLSVVGFVDTGNVFQRVAQVNVGELRSAVGFGVRYQSPFGPLRVDLGFKTHLNNFACPTDADPLKTCPESRPALQISFGQAF